MRENYMRQTGHFLRRAGVIIKKYALISSLFLATMSCSFAAQTNQVLIIGTAPENPPLSFQADDKNHFYGFEVDIMNAICQRMNIICEFKPVVVGSILQELNEGQIDFAIAALVAPSKPLQGFTFSLPYLQSGGQFMTLHDSPINIPRDIENKRVGVRRGTLGGGTIFQDLILRLYDQHVTVIQYPSMNALLFALSNQDVDVIFSNELPIKYWYYNNKEIYKLVGSKIPVGNSYVILATDKYTGLMKQVNQALLDIMSDGTYLEIYNRYFSAMN